MENFKYRYWLLIFLFALAGCEDEEELVNTEEEEIVVEVDRLIEGQRLFKRSKGEAEGLISQIGSDDITSLTEDFQYDVTFYEVTYKTEYLGEEIEASGLVTFPESMEVEVPMISFQNGTIASNAEAPTENNNFKIISGVASLGYILVIPDYIGFGASSEFISPYHNAEYTASAVIDLAKAARELAYQEGYAFSGDLFLSGYSEGGYATMAAHKQFEQESPQGFELVASAPSSGGYDVKGFQEYFFDLEMYDNPFFMAFVALSYQTVYGYEDPLSELFQEPYATNIPQYFDGSMSGSQINAQLTTTVADYIQPDVLANIDTDPEYSNFVDALNDNSLLDWQPLAPMYMYHGTADITVPYQNSVDTYDALISNGASADLVTLTDLPGKTHGSGFFPYLYEALTLFESLK